MTKSIGQIIRETREEKNIPLSKVAEDLFIRTTYLQAIENDRTEILPSPVQGRGFVRMYAEYLNMDVKQVLDAWDHPEAPVSETNEQEIPKIESTQPLSSVSGLAEEVIPAPSESLPFENEIPETDPVNAIFKQIGRELKQRRESLLLTFEDAETHTLVRSIYLKLMEDGNFDALPSPVQARGMLNNYAAFLNLNVDDIMLRYANALQLKAASRIFEAPEKTGRMKKEQAKKPVKTVSKLRRFMTPDLFVGLTVLIGMAAIIIYSAVTIAEYRSQASTPTADLDQLFISQLATNDETATPTIEAALTSSFVQNPLEAIQVPVDSTMVVSETEQNLTQSIQIFIEASQRTYLQVKSDGAIVYSGRTVPGNTYPFDGSELIEVTTGNGAALKITYNQHDLGTIGTLGQVVSLQFTNNLVLTPTPSTSVTPTETFVPTFTPESVRVTPTQTITPYIP